jgi:hypothetical protein
MKLLPLAIPFSARKNSSSKLLLLIALLAGLLVLPAAAQSAAAQLPTRTVADSIRQVAIEDTTYAVQRLFHHQRRLNLSRSLLWGAGLGFYGTLGVVKSYRTGSVTDKVLASALIGTMGTLLIRSIIRGYAYRGRRERKIIADLEKGYPLPAKVRAKLRPNDFSTSISTSP